MAKYKFYTTDVFTNIIFGGNPLAVFPDARGISSELMQKIAKEFNLSETTFVLPPNNSSNTKQLRIFTPATELPFAGHPTVGTAYVLASIGDIPLENEITEIVFEEKVGPVGVSIHSQHGKPKSAYLTAAQLPKFGPSPPEPSIIASALSLDKEDLLLGDWNPEAVSCGVPFFFIPVRDRKTLGKAAVNLEHWKKHLQSSWFENLYIFCFEPEHPEANLRSRMFAPAMGVPEDPATGAAASALAGYLGIRESVSHGELQWMVEQGFEMGRPSILYVQAQKVNGRIETVRVGGESVMVSEGRIEIV